jgi:glycosyltransferase involved in cell wall biosynthesis
MSETEPIPISVCILTKNCETKIEHCLQGLRAFDDVLVMDTGSTDNTLKMIETFSNVRVFHQDGIGNFSTTRNIVSEKTKYDWVLHLDSDEFVTPEFLSEIKKMERKPNTVYSIYRQLIYCGKRLPPFDARTNRLYNRRETAWGDRIVHESINIRSGMSVLSLKAPVEHHSFDSVDQLIDKLQYYSTLFAEQFRSEKKVFFWSPFFHGFCSFLKHYLFRGAFLYGYLGWLFASCFAFGSFLKYVKLIEDQEKKK